MLNRGIHWRRLTVFFQGIYIYLLWKMSTLAIPTFIPLRTFCGVDEKDFAIGNRIMFSLVFSLSVFQKWNFVWQRCGWLALRCRVWSNRDEVFWYNFLERNYIRAWTRDVSTFWEISGEANSIRYVINLARFLSWVVPRQVTKRSDSIDKNCKIIAKDKILEVFVGKLF